MPSDKPGAVEAVLLNHPAGVQSALRACRSMIFGVAENHSEIGPLTETLKWGEPAYLTGVTKSGSTLRLSTTRKDHRVALFVNCKTNLIEQFRTQYPTTFDYEGARALVLKTPPEEVVLELEHCIALTLTYHLRKK